MKHPVRHVLAVMIASAAFAAMTPATASEAFADGVDPIGFEALRDTALTRDDVRAQTALARETGTLDLSGEAAPPSLQLARNRFNHRQVEAHLAQLAIEQAPQARTSLPLEVESYVVFEDIAPGVLVVGLNDAGHAVRGEFFRDVDPDDIEKD